MSFSHSAPRVCPSCGDFTTNYRKKTGICKRCIDNANNARRRTDKKFRYGQYCASVRTRGREPLAFGDWLTFWQKPCAWCKQPLRTIGVDRIDNEGPYVIANCQSLCLPCNAFKGRQSNDAALAHIAAIAAAHPEISPRPMDESELIWGRRTSGR